MSLAVHAASSTESTVAGVVLTTVADDAVVSNSSSSSLMDDVDVDLDAELLFHNILYKVVVPVMFGLIIGVGVVGNALVIYVTLTCRV